MNTDDLNRSTTEKCESEVTPGGLSKREQAADRVPFFLRAWWLREFKQETNWKVSTHKFITGPLWSSHSDPLCDQGNLDFGNEAV